MANVSENITRLLFEASAYGWDSDLLIVVPGATAAPDIQKQLAKVRGDCGGVGGAIRPPSAGLVFFEAVADAICQAAPHSAIALNTSPGASAEAARRRIGA